MLGFTIWKFLFIIINFLALYAILKKLFFRKVLEILEERRQNIARAVATIDTAKAEVEQIRKSGEGIIAQAQEEAQVILKRAQKVASDTMAEAKAEAEKYIQETRISIEREKEEIKQEVYSTLIDLVSMASRKVMSHVMSEQEQQKLVEIVVKDSWGESSFIGSSN